MHDQSPSSSRQQPQPAQTGAESRVRDRVRQIATDLGQTAIREVLFVDGNSFMARYDTRHDTLTFQRGWMDAAGGPESDAVTWTIHHELGHRGDKNASTVAWMTGLAVLVVIPVAALVWGLWRSISDAVKNDFVFETDTLLPAVASILIGVAIVAPLRWLLEFRADDFAADRLGDADGLGAAFDATPSTIGRRTGTPTHPPVRTRLGRQRRRHPRAA
ncbi:hypothetical protein [Rhodococcus sp. NPDC059234]|uniref:hypothetical protein n=1 Tax=Rhodococcus sp. NPDC059234 TaxID=3346781 RepID=UPI00367189F6